MSRIDELKNIIAERVNEIEGLLWDADQLKRNHIDGNYQQGDQAKWKLMEQMADVLYKDVKPYSDELDKLEYEEWLKSQKGE